MAESTRPKRVVIVDADNPLQEIHGEFFWREDHERALAIEREHAFREGYERGLQDGAKKRARGRGPTAFAGGSLACCVDCSFSRLRCRSWSPLIRSMTR